MSFSIFCVGIVIVFAVFVISYVMSCIAWGASVDDFAGPWAVSSIGFGICITILLYQNGVIH